MLNKNKLANVTSSLNLSDGQKSFIHALYYVNLYYQNMSVKEPKKYLDFQFLSIFDKFSDQIRIW